MDAAIGNGLQFSLVVAEFFVLVAQGFESFLDGFLGGAAGGGVELFLGAINLKERVCVVVLARSQCEFGRRCFRCSGASRRGRRHARVLPRRRRSW